MNDMELPTQLHAYLNRFSTFAAPRRAVLVPLKRVNRLNLLGAVAVVALVVAILAVPIVLGRLGAQHSTPAVHPKPTPTVAPGPPLHHNGLVVMAFANTLVELDVTNGAEHPLFSAPTHGVITDPTYSPDGSQIAYLRGTLTAGGFEAIDSIWVLDTRTDHARLLTTCSGCAVDDSISWSPDGSRLSFAEADERRILQLELIDADGTHKTQLTHLAGIANAYQPTWSPDGARIAFLSTNAVIQGAVSSLVDIDVIRPDGTGFAVLAPAMGKDADHTAPLFLSWSPDGSRLAYVLDPPQPGATYEGQYQLWLMDPDGSRRSEIFHSDGCCRGGGTFSGPAWAPDGTRIAVDVENTFWLLKPDGSSPQSLAGEGGVRPTWQPVP